MSVHALLARRLGPRAATVLAAAFYAAVIVAILLLLPARPAPFHYGRY